VLTCFPRRSGHARTGRVRAGSRRGRRGQDAPHARGAAGAEGVACSTVEPLPRNPSALPLRAADRRAGPALTGSRAAQLAGTGRRGLAARDQRARPALAELLPGLPARVPLERDEERRVGGRPRAYPLALGNPAHLIVLEDLHQARPGHARGLARLAPRAAPPRCSLPAPSAATKPVAATTSGKACSLSTALAAVQHVALTGLTAEDTARLVQQALEWQAPSGV